MIKRENNVRRKAIVLLICLTKIRNERGGREKKSGWIYFGGCPLQVGVLVKFYGLCCAEGRDSILRKLTILLFECIIC